MRSQPLLPAAVGLKSRVGTEAVKVNGRCFQHMSKKVRSNREALSSLVQVEFSGFFRSHSDTLRCDQQDLSTAPAT